LKQQFVHVRTQGRTMTLKAGGGRKGGAVGI